MLKLSFSRLKKFILIGPARLVLSSLIIFLLLSCSIETARAWHYQIRVKDYKNSAAVQNLHDIVDKLQRSVEKDPPALYCYLNFENLIVEFNDAYSSTSYRESEAEILVSSLKSQLEKAMPPPSFSSALSLLPNVQNSRRLSSEMNEALKNIQLLTENDPRSTYCLALRKVFSRIYFLKSLSSIEGAVALLPGQIENFQVNIRQAEEQLKRIKAVPEVFKTEHTAFFSTLQSISKSLQADTDRYEAFTRRLQREFTVLKDIALNIEGKATDLQRRPQLIALQASYLKD